MTIDCLSANVLAHRLLPATQRGHRSEGLVAGMSAIENFDTSSDSFADVERRTETQYLLSPPNVGSAERNALLASFDSGWIAPVGPQLDEFEQRFAEAVGSPAAVALSSGTAALHLALRVAGVQRGDEVVVSSLTFAASANPICYEGAQPVFIDSEADTWNMDPDLLDEFLMRRALRDRLPAAVVVVDILGQCAQLTRIRNICNAYNLPLIEDAAEALGATHHGQSSGTFGRMGAFSFNGNKTITTGGGGMLVGSPEDIAYARFLSTQAKEPVPWYEHREVGFNYRMSNLLAGVGLAQLERLDELVAAQRSVFSWYQAAFANTSAVRVMPSHPEGVPSSWLTAVTIEGVPDLDTEIIRRLMGLRGIECRAVWKPLHLQHAYDGAEVVGGEVSERLFQTGLCMPSGTQLTESDVFYIAGTLCAAIEAHADIRSGSLSRLNAAS